MNRNILLISILAICIVTGVPAQNAGGQSNDQPPNILFIAIDDLNDCIGPLANHLPRAMTPNLDRLADMGVTFTNAHCAGPVCHPSRVSVMTGVHPSRSGIINNVFTSKGKPTWRTGPHSGT